MWAHPLVLISVGVVAAVTVVATVYTSYRDRYQPHSRYRGQEPELPPPERRNLGPCGMCSGIVSFIDGFQAPAPCHHFVHYTCNADVAREFRGVPFKWHQVCRACLSDRMNSRENQPQNAGLWHRNNTKKCANCGINFAHMEQDIKTLECDHRVHGACYERMQTTGFTTCPTCISDM